MASSVFDDKSKRPQETELKAALGKSFAQWNELQKIIASRFEPVSIEWGFSTG